ncbi:hypothetical protein GCM10028824_44020 [Hymenobacter segetis]
MIEQNHDDITLFKKLYADLRVMNKSTENVIDGKVTPVFIGGNLIQLSIVDMPLDSIPSSINMLRHLYELTIFNCKLKDIKNIHNPIITSLNISKNNFSNIPNLKKALPNLKYLDISDNLLEGRINITGLNDSISSISFAKNKIRVLTFKEPLENLTSADFSYNELSEIDASICEKTALKYINISNNPLKSKTRTTACGTVLITTKNYID